MSRHQNAGESRIYRGADKSLAFPISYFHILSTIKNYFLDGLKKLEQRSHKCVELKEICRANTIFQSVACFLYKAEDLSAPLVFENDSNKPKFGFMSNLKAGRTQGMFTAIRFRIFSLPE
jgi:hypothetical protein